MAVLATALLLGLSCGGRGESDEAFPSVVTLGEGEVFPAILNDSLAVGENRLILSLTDVDDALVHDARVTLRFFDLNGEDPVETAAAEARFVPTELGYVDEQAPAPEPTDTGHGGAYIAKVSFARAGEWGFKALVTTASGDTLQEAPFRFEVAEESSEPQIGDDAPPSQQATTATAALEDIDSSYPLRPAMHDITIADALRTGRPLVIAFATPAYCRSRTCAPIMETVMDPLFERYGEEAHFIHVEPYELRDLRAGFVQNAVPATREWRIQSEPWLFVVDRDGRIAGKFQGVVAPDEVESLLRTLLP